MCGGANGVYLNPTRPIKLERSMSSHICIGAPKSRYCFNVTGEVEYILNPVFVAIDIKELSQLKLIECIILCLSFCICYFILYYINYSVFYIV